MSSPRPKEYRSKVDWWIAFLVFGLPTVLLFMGSYIAAAIDVIPGVMLIGIAVFQFALNALFGFPLRYILTRNSLIIRYGLFRETIPYERIRDAVPSANPLSAPALSLKRVKIVLDKGFRLISPEDREKFLNEIHSKIKTGNKDE